MAADNGSDDDLISYKKPKILRRQLVVMFSVTSAFIMCLLRYNLSVAIVAISKEKIQIDLPSYSNISNNEISLSKNKYEFSDIIIGQILASYFYGYTIFQLPAGRFSELFGARWLLGLGTFLSGILSILTPLMFDIHWIAVCVVRFLIGVLHASVLSCAYVLYSEWLPNNLKSTAINYLNLGFELGAILSFYLTGVILNYLSWQFSFYLFSIVSFIWFPFFYFMCYSNPDSDPYLSDYERNLIQQERKQEYLKEDFSKKIVKIPPKLSAKILLTSPVVWASCFAKSAIGIGYYIITLKMPSYLVDIFKLNISDTGLYTSFAELSCFLSKFICLSLSSYLINLKLMSLTNLRKTSQSIAMLLPVLCLGTIIIKNDCKEMVIFLMCASMFGFGFNLLGDSPMTSEFAKDLAGSIFGYTNSFSCLQGILTPLISGLVLEAYPNDKVFAYNIVFFSTIIFFLISTVIFLLFATSQPQEWACSKFVTAKEKNKTKENV